VFETLLAYDVENLPARDHADQSAVLDHGPASMFVIKHRVGNVDNIVVRVLDLDFRRHHVTDNCGAVALIVIDPGEQYSKTIEFRQNTDDLAVLIDHHEPRDFVASDYPGCLIDSPMR
jgi:hypothetical protein